MMYTAGGAGDAPPPELSDEFHRNFVLFGEPERVIAAFVDVIFEHAREGRQQAPGVAGGGVQGVR